MQTLLLSPQVGEIIAVDDGSTDRTGTILGAYREHARARILLLPENQGKGHAMTAAAQQASGEILLFIDADLNNLSERHISLLLEPIRAGEAQMVIGIPVRSARISPLERLDPCRPLSGQRAVYRDDFLRLAGSIRDSGYGVETILNLRYREMGKPVLTIPLPYLTHLIKVEKTPLHRAVPEYLREGKQILATMLKNPEMVWAALRSTFGW
jgi:glycosyltransferase involved in cell wall biosynthesis